MKKVVACLMFLVLASGALAMDDPIRVKATSGDEVKVYVWPTGSGQLLNMNKGIVNEEGIFETTFFSLNVADIRYQIMVIRGGEKVLDVDFIGLGISEQLNIDCTGSGCVVVEEIENETIEVIVENETIIVENETVEESNFLGVTGMVIFDKGKEIVGSSYFVGGVFVLLLAFVFGIILVYHGKKKKDVVVLDEDEIELRDMTKKVKDAADKIAKVKEKKARKDKLEKAKIKLAEEEAELKKLEAEANEEKEEVRVIEKVEEKPVVKEDVVEKSEGDIVKKDEENVVKKVENEGN